MRKLQQNPFCANTEPCFQIKQLQVCHEEHLPSTLYLLCSLYGTQLPWSALVDDPLRPHNIDLCRTCGICVPLKITHIESKPHKLHVFINIISIIKPF